MGLVFQCVMTGNDALLVDCDPKVAITYEEPIPFVKFLVDFGT